MIPITFVISGTGEAMSKQTLAAQMITLRLSLPLLQEHLKLPLQQALGQSQEATERPETSTPSPAFN